MSSEIRPKSFGAFENSPQGAIQPGPIILARYLQTGPGFSARPNGLKNPCNRYHVFSSRAEKGTGACPSTVFSHLSKFAFCARADIEHGIATMFQPGGRSEISARAETHHVIRPLFTFHHVLIGYISWRTNT